MSSQVRNNGGKWKMKAHTPTRLAGPCSEDRRAEWIVRKGGICVATTGNTS